MFLASVFTPIYPSFSYLLWAVDYMENNSKSLYEWLPLNMIIKAQYNYWQDESWFPSDSELDHMQLELVID